MNVGGKIQLTVRGWGETILGNARGMFENT